MKAIRFNTEEVCAILDGRKTQTRRVIKPHIVDKFVIDEDGRLLGSYMEGEEEGYPTIDDAPHQEGDILYVQETFGNYSLDNQCSHATGWVYKADYPDGAKGYWYEPEKINWCDLPRWRPSSHMPQEAARLFLRVTGVRVERLQDITDEDAIAEGFTGLECEHLNGLPCTDCHNSGWIEPPMVDFMYVWDSKTKKSGLSKRGWDANPWVWVYEFEVCEESEVRE